LDLKHLQGKPILVIPVCYIIDFLEEMRPDSVVSLFEVMMGFMNIAWVGGYLQSINRELFRTAQWMGEIGKGKRGLLSQDSFWR
jgi:hypothetical protein